MTGDHGPDGADYLRLLANGSGETVAWPVGLTVPRGWEPTGFVGDLVACASYLTVHRNGARDTASPVRVAAVVPAALSQRSGRPALGGRHVLSYADLACRAAAVARSLDEAGVRSHDPVALRTTSASGTLVGLLGTGVCDTVAVPESVATRVALIDDAARGGDAVGVRVHAPGAPARRWSRSGSTATVLAAPGDGREPTLIAVPDAAVERLAAAARRWRIRPEDRVAWTAPAFSALGLLQIWSTLACGACLQTGDGASDPTTVAAASATSFSSRPPPETLRLVLSDGEIAADRRAGLQRHGVEISEFWLSPAIGGLCALRSPDGRWRPAFPDSTYVLDTDFRPVSRGGVGYLFVGGAAATGGMVNQPERELGIWFPDPFAANGARMVAVGHRVVADELDGHRAVLVRPAGHDRRVRPPRRRT